MKVLWHNIGHNPVGYLLGISGALIAAASLAIAIVLLPDDPWSALFCGFVAVWVSLVESLVIGALRDDWHG